MKRAALILALALAACSPQLHLAQQSAPPFGRTARLQVEHGFWGPGEHRLDLSQGVALALACYSNGYCKDMKVSSDHPEILEVRAASLAKLHTSYYGATSVPASFIVIGRQAGTAILHVESKSAKRDIPVRVLPAKLPSPPAELAKEPAPTAAK